MSEIASIFATTPDVIQDAQPTLVRERAVQLPPARRHYPQPSRYLEQSRMAREMERL
jgi:hypothetical protein